MAVTRRLRLPTPQRALQLLQIALVIYVLYAEWLVYSLATWGCGWPKPGVGPDGRPLVAPGDRPAHLLVVADISLIDWYNGPRERLASVIGDLSVRRTWSAATSFHPDAVVFLGDMLDDGRFIREEDDTLQKIFRLPKGVDALWVAGNRDVGLGHSASFSARYRQYFSMAFDNQPLNHVARIGNHTLVLLDSPGLVEEDYRRFGAEVPFDEWKGSHGGAIDFLKSLNVQDSNEKVVLFSHIPLSRPEHAFCGPLREHSKGIQKGVGRGYQNLIEKQTTKFVLEHVRPSLIMSADDTDYCEVSHLGPDGVPIREVTIKALAIHKGIRRAGFQLLSLSSGGGAQDAPCFMPNPHRLYTRGYFPLIVLTIALSAYFTSRPLAARRERDQPRGAIPQPIWSAASSSSFGSLFGAGAAAGGESPPHTPFALGSFRSHSRPTTPNFSSSVLHLMPETDADDMPSSSFGLGLTLHPQHQYPYQPNSPGVAMSPVTPMTGTGPSHDAASFLPAPGSRKVPLSRGNGSYTSQAQVAATRLRFGAVGRVWRWLIGVLGFGRSSRKGGGSSLTQRERERDRTRWWRVAWQTAWPALALWTLLAVWTAW
ncbi:hypothetical protein BKA62DRAFT_699433 [Auriculariales sp. MPI-PUGE-AT-0066]|nr:hypothetical protein BKA62DRAFT_699433 [Auriculariales sp. MPI-PUGE-AT-0066]